MEHHDDIARAIEVGWLWLIPFFPLLGAALNVFLGPRLQKQYGKRAVHTIAIGAMVLSCLITEIVFWTQMVPRGPEDRFLENHLWTMWESGALKVDLSFGIDPLGMVMTLIVTHVATLIHVYSVGYMADEPSYWRFFFWLNLFVFSMLLLVMGSNFPVMFFGWEGVGLCSYGLIAFWYTDIEKAKAGMKAFVVNRFGDFGFIIGLFVLFWSLSGAWQPGTNKYLPERGLAGPIRGSAAEPARVSPHGTRLGPTMEFRELRNQITDQSTGMAQRLGGMTLWGFPVLAVICILFFVGAVGKSAQIPLYVWLPDAMAGPTPVSALIHAATMVTAGVYMVARLNFLFALSAPAMTVVAVTGVVTAIFATSIGFFQYDIKKVLAYSTVSQLGVMFIGVGVGAYWAGIFHLMTHAFFKACLFLGSGSVILACHHEQDMRKMGGLSGAVAALGTSFYMFRSYYMTFTGEYRGGKGHPKDSLEDPHAVATHAHAAAIIHGVPDEAMVAHAAAASVPHRHDPHEDPEHVAEHAAAAVAAAAAAHGAVVHAQVHEHGGEPHESPRSMTAVLQVLAIAAVIAGVIFGLPAAWTGGHEPLLEKWLAPSIPGAEYVKFAEPGHSTEYLFQAIGFGIAAFGWLAALVLYKDARSTVPARLKATFPRAWAVVYNKYYVDEFYQATIVRGALVLAAIQYWIDQNVIDRFVNFMGWLARAVAYLDNAFDVLVVDGAVNGLARMTWDSGRALRRLQTGHIQAYLYGALGGAIVFVIIQYVIR